MSQGTHKPKTSVIRAHNTEKSMFSWKVAILMLTAENRRSGHSSNYLTYPCARHKNTVFSPATAYIQGVCGRTYRAEL